jgi:uncharacterized protein YueI
MQEQLPGFVLANLFSRSLVVATNTAEKSIQKKVAQEQQWFLGGYEKKIILLVDDAQSVYLSDEALQFLTGILSACRLNLADIALINVRRHSLSYQQMKKQMQPQFLLMFGVSALQIELPFIMPDYKVQVCDNCSILIAPALRTLDQTSENAKNEKTKLWKSLRRMFEVK